jgi:hypothetical protein
MTEPELRECLNEAARAAQSKLPPRSLFVLLAFDSDGIAQYVSNIKRSGIIQSMRKCADRLEAGEDVTK